MSQTQIANHLPDAANPSPSRDVFVLPASFAQRRLWFIDQLDPGSPTYNVLSAFRVSGDLDRAVLERALNEIVARHETLRTTFRLVEGEPFQLIEPELPLRVAMIDLRALSAGDGERELACLAARAAALPFDLTVGPLIRATLVQLADAEHALLLTLHHIITDLWSAEVLMGELTALYEAFESNAPSPLAELPIQYADFASWQREHLQGELLDRELAYWRKKLDGLAPLELPLARPRPLLPAHEGRAMRVEISAPLAVELKKLAAREGVSLFMLMLAAWKTLLARYSAQTDVSVGSPISNRNRAETEPLIGFFLNTLVLRTDLAGHPTFCELLARVRATVLGAFEHQEMPFEMLVETLHPARVAGQNPLFNVAFVLVHGDAKTWSAPGLTFTPMPVADTSAKFDLTLSLDESCGKIAGTLAFDTELFDEDFIARMIGHFHALLEGIAANPDARIEAVPIVAGAEREQLVNAWNRTAAPFPAEQTVHAIFEEQAARHPDAIAIESGELRVSYAELNRRANQLARHLRALGVKRGACVGVSMERSLELIVSLLGIVKAGGVYVPLDTASPPERVALMIEESGCEIVLTCAASVDLPAREKTQVINFDAVDFSPCDAANLDATGAGDDRAYVIFTSGSTGKPKGVVVPHRAIVRLVIGTDYAQLTPDDVVAHASNVAFDAATFEIWGALLNGAKLAIVPREIVLSASEFAAFIAARGITSLFLTTALFNQFARQNPAAFRSLTHLLFGGEACNPDCVRRVLEQGAPRRLLHVYGPTEATTFASWHLVREVPADAVTVPIGRPIANTTIHLLDAQFEPVPLGVVGEIFVGGPGLAIGYLNDPELTAQRFVETPLGRLYRTGDLARRRAEGAIEFRGRVDAQVKLRGFRIEPREIEAALEQHPLVRQATVIAHAEAGAVQSLIGYLVPQSSERADFNTLREFLSRLLPASMIPTACVWIDALPLTANGKLDVRKLPLPEAESAASAVAPRNEIERRIATVWTEVLGRNHLSLDDDFFLIGGHSILAIQMLARMREKMSVDVPVKRLFETPTIRGLAEFVTAKLPAPADGNFKSIVMIQRGEAGRTPLFFVPGGWGGEIEFLVYAQMARQLDSSLPLYGLRLRGSSTDPLPQASVEEFAAAFVADICAFQPEGPCLIGGECVGGIIAYEVVRQLQDAGREVALLILLGTTWPNRDRLNTFAAVERKKQRDAIWKTRVREPARRHWENLGKLNLSGKIRYVWQRVRRNSAVRTFEPISSDRDLLTEYPRRLMAHALRPHAGRVTLILDEQSHERSGKLGWDTHHPGPLELHVVPGDHVSYIRAHAASTATILREILDRALPRRSC